MPDNLKPDLAAEYVAEIQDAIVVRANRERLWDMKMWDVDLEAMAEEIVERLQQFDGEKRS